MDKLNSLSFTTLILTATVAIATIAYLFIEMPIATLWSFVMVALVGHSNRKRDEPVRETHQEAEKMRNK